MCLTLGMKMIKLFGLNFTEIPLRNICENIISGEYSGKSIVTPNVDHVIRYHKSEYFRMVYSKSDIFINDSRILKLLSKLTPNRLNIVCPGSDLTKELFEEYFSSRKFSINVIGAERVVIDKIQSKYPLLEIFHYNPPMGFDNDVSEIEKCINLCVNSGAEITFLAVGSPRQEILADHIKSQDCDTTILCIGASLLFISGDEIRAPLIFRILHCEWMFRLLQSPRRLAKRYLVDGWSIFPILYKEILKK
jgi:N-acetylglucosaminyldiphosphoundecaprenol N-acetyl-beta-D-mannosaminyltransferase